MLRRECVEKLKKGKGERKMGLYPVFPLAVFLDDRGLNKLVCSAIRAVARSKKMYLKNMESNDMETLVDSLIDEFVNLAKNDELFSKEEYFLDDLKMELERVFDGLVSGGAELMVVKYHYDCNVIYDSDAFVCFVFDVIGFEC